MTSAVFETRHVPAQQLELPGRRSYAVAGSLPPRPRLAIVGSRAALRHLRAAVPAAAGVLGLASWSIVSGGALGIDGDAHRAALRIDIPQVAVLPCGPDSVYPPAHAELFDAMVRSQRASLVFAHPPGTAPARGMFASRNRLVVALADAVLVVQAQLRSGSMLTGRLALADGKPTAAILGSPGVATLVAEGAVALRWEASQPGEFETTLRRWLASPRDVAASAGAAWPPRLHWLRDALARSGSRGVTVDRLGDPIAAAVALVEAETLGLVVEAAPGRYAAT